MKVRKVFKCMTCWAEADKIEDLDILTDANGHCVAGDIGTISYAKSLDELFTQLPTKKPIESYRLDILDFSEQDNKEDDKEETTDS